jgi:hypothetical protein
MGYILVANMGLVTINQHIKLYMLTIYIIHVKCANIMVNHHLQLNVECNFTYVINGFLVASVDCNLFVVTNYSRKLIFFLMHYKKSCHMQPFNLQIHANINHLQVILVIFITILKILVIFMTMLQLNYNCFFILPYGQFII